MGGSSTELTAEKEELKIKIQVMVLLLSFQLLTLLFPLYRTEFLPSVSLVINLFCNLSTIISLLLQHLPASWDCPTICSTECTALYLVLLASQHVQKWNCHSTNKIWLTTYFCQKHYHSCISNITFEFYCFTSNNQSVAMS